MRWRHALSLGVLFISIYCAHALESQIKDENRSPNSDIVIHNPSPFLSIAGDLNDVKLKSSIDQLVRALQTPSQSQQAEEEEEIRHNKPEIITKQNVNVHSQQGRKLFSGADVPEPIVISSQAIRINSNKTGGKRSRSMTSVDSDGVKTIEGVRVPDDEHDKHYTWRNARVIKGFLVPNDKAPNPHKKRQVVIHTDPSAYLAAAAAAQSQGATAIIDGRQTAYVQPDLSKTAAFYNAQLAQYQQQSQQPVPQPHQYQAAGAQGGQATALSYAQQQGQMYVLNDGNGHSYLQYSPVQADQAQQQQPVSQVSSHSQSQFSSRSGEPATSSQPQQTLSSQNLQQIQQQIAQFQNPPVQVQSVPVQDQQVQLSEQAIEAQLARDILAAQASGAQYIVQTPQQYQVPQQTFAERQGQGAVQATPNGFVIQPQTYVTGPGGQKFTIPIPIPAEQAQQQQQQQQLQQPSQRHNWYQQQQGQQGQHQQRPNNKPNHLYGKSKNNFAERVMDALHTNKKALDRIDTSSAIVPALASTGIFLGLSALAAGWYLSKGNREVGIVRRTGKPRIRRDVGQPVNNYPQEVDQATFFQSIIQQSLEKTQQQYEDQQVVEPVYNQQQPVYAREPEPERINRPNKNFRINRPQNRDDNEDYDNHKSSKTQFAQEKSGALTIGSSKNFARVFIPALILGLSVISISALIFGWYVTGSNREIAFLEPASYSRKKRSLTALSDGWLQKTITAMHHNPYDRIPAPTTKSLLPHPFMTRETSKTSDLEFKISNTGLTKVLAGGALFAIVALGLANSLSEPPSRHLKNGRANTMNTNSRAKQNRAPRSVVEGTNDLAEAQPDNPSFLATVLSAVEVVEKNVVSKLNDVGLFDPKSPCSKRVVCEILTSQDDDTIQTTEKRVTTFLNLLPDSVSSPLKETFGDIVSSVSKRDCSSFICNNRGVPSVKISPATVKSSRR